jgi:hypothetical protein
MSLDQQISHFEHQLNSFDPAQRRQALNSLALMVETGNVSIQPPREIANMHCHSFFSYNGYDMSPSGLAWMAKREGIKLLGIVDFDVLDGVEEFLDACQLLNIRGTAGLETRIYLKEFRHDELNSPGEPGISYHMGVGFSTNSLPETGQAIINDMKQRAGNRNRAMITRLNEYLSPLHLDYEVDVLPLTPAGNATERHILTALVNKTRQVIPDFAGFWAQKLDVPVSSVEEMAGDIPNFKNLIRARLMKRGGVAYMQPDESTFPGVDEAHQLITGAGAIPCVTWLDGTSSGEQKIEELLVLLIEKGAGALNIVPDRNWNIADPAVKMQKIANLYKVTALADQFDLPVMVGTEMNAPGQKFVDDFGTPELAPVRDTFLRGAYFLYGHTIMARFAGMGYQSAWADRELRTRKNKNEFYEKAGNLVGPKAAGSILSNIGTTMTPDEVIAVINTYRKEYDGGNNGSVR